MDASVALRARPRPAPDAQIALVLHPRHALRREAEALVEGVYQESFGVRLSSHFPVLLALVDAAGRVRAAAGCRFAGASPLFLEQYLDEPVEAAISRQHHCSVGRDQIAEIGSLATSGGASVAMLFAALAQHLRDEGVAFATATATRRLRRAFAAFGFGALELGKASADRLPCRGRDWGRYFEHDPIVVAGRVTSGCVSLGRFGGGAA